MQHCMNATMYKCKVTSVDGSVLFKCFETGHLMNGDQLELLVRGQDSNNEQKY